MLFPSGYPASFAGFAHRVFGWSAAAARLGRRVELAAGRDEVIAVGVNCCTPRDVLPAVELAREATGKPAVAYPNSGERWNAAAHRWEGPAAFSPALAAAWRDSGARLVGGCCRVGPSAITAVRAALSDGLP